MRKLLLLVAVIALLAVPAFAQQFENSKTGALTASGSTCATDGACVELRLPLGVGSGAIVLTGTFTGQVEFEATVDHVNWFAILAVPPNSQTAVTNATTANTWVTRLASYRYLRVRASALSAGRVQVFLLGSTAPISVISIT
jgi:hypothetical protein